MKCRTLTPAALTLTLALCASAVETNEVHAWRQKYEADLDHVNSSHTTAVTNLQSRYIAALTDLKAEAQAEGDLDLTLAILAEMKRFDIARTIPSDLSKTAFVQIRDLQTAYADTLSALERAKAKRLVDLVALHDKALDRLQKQFTRDGALDDAIAVSEERKELKTSEQFLSATQLTDSRARPALQPSPPSSAGQALSLPGCIAYYPLDGNSRDASGGAHDGSVSSARRTADRFGETGCAYAFDGRTSYIAIEDLPQPTSSVTVSVWANPDKGLKEGRLYAVVSSEQQAGFGIDVNESAHWYWAVHIRGRYRVATSNRPLERDRWQHLVGVYDGRYVQLYVDGERQASGDSVGGSITLSPLPLTIGANPQPRGSPRLHFLGAIDEVQLYDRALTSNEVQLLHGVGPRSGP